MEKYMFNMEIKDLRTYVSEDTICSTSCHSGVKKLIFKLEFFGDKLLRSQLLFYVILNRDSVVATPDIQRALDTYNEIT